MFSCVCLSVLFCSFCHFLEYFDLLVVFGVFIQGISNLSVAGGLFIYIRLPVAGLLTTHFMYERHMKVTPFWASWSSIHKEQEREGKVLI